MSSRSPVELSIGLYERGAVGYASSIGEFIRLRSERMSPAYVNLRPIASFSENHAMPVEEQREVRDLVVSSFSDLLDISPHNYDHILGVPHAMTAVAGLVAQARGDSLLTMRSSADKKYGVHKPIEGDYREGDVVIALDDAITDGGAKLDTIARAEELGLVIPEVAVLVDREEGGREALEEMGYGFSSAIGLGGITYVLAEQGIITSQQRNWMEKYYVSLVEGGIIPAIPKSLVEGPEDWSLPS